MGDHIIPIKQQYLAEALALVRRVFHEYEAPEYSAEGIAEFEKYIAVDSIRGMLAKGELNMWGFTDGDTVIGVIALRPPGHISLLFVDSCFHNQGIARQLLVHVLTHTQCGEMTVNSSPYAAGFYRKMGFADTDTEQTDNGIRFIPMKRSTDA